MKKTYGLLALIFAVNYCMAQPNVSILPFATGFPNGISDIATAGDSRLFVAEQLGYISIVDSAGNKLPGYFLDIKSKVTPTSSSSLGEQGLLGIAFSPNYANDGFFYVNYTNKTGMGNTVIARYHVSPNPDSADAASEQILLTIYQPYSNHNGGCIKFGADGYLYIATGDGGSFGDPGNCSQNTDSLLGKMLRIDVSGGAGYSIPPTNPFAVGGGAPEVWAYGLRNPWRFSFDRVFHNMWIADVGQDVYEEINYQSAASVGGENYGWRCYEGLNHPYNTAGCQAASSYVAPVSEYSHAGGRCSVTGGFIYRGTGFPPLFGYYFFADYCTGQIFSLSPTNVQSVAGTFSGKYFSTFGENAAGELFIGDQASGIVYRLAPQGTGITQAESSASGISVLPNPNKGVFTCRFVINNSAMADISVLDLAGKKQSSENKWITTGTNLIQMDVKNLANGFYFMEIKTEKETISRCKFQVVK